MSLTIPPGLEAALQGHYRIERAIGQGGMALVFLAIDLRHDRPVALKILRPELAAVIGASRFLAEIKVTANLQHPHILPLHDSGEADGTVYYVMPYVEGESLRDRLTREHQLPIAEALRIAKEVASALDYAHRRGVVHRDIKPENILLHDGQALIADFGIALAVSRTETASRMTETGMSLGTPHYMAPEQAMGEREITSRADVYALGAVLYEMLSGEPPFTGGTAQAVVARALTETPRGLTIQRHTVPPHVEATVMRALEKLPADRFPSAHEFSEALDDPTRTVARTVATPVRGIGTRDPWRLALGGLALAAVVALAWSWSREVAEPPVTRFALDFPPRAGALGDRTIAVSPDGKYLAYLVGIPSGNRVLHLKAIDEVHGRPLAGTEGVLTFAFAPDGRHLALVITGNVLLTIPVLGGATTPIARSVSAAPAPLWLPDGRIAYYTTGVRTIAATLAAAGGTADTLWRSDSIIPQAAAMLTLAPGGRHLLFARCNINACDGSTELMALDLDGGGLTLVATGILRAVPLVPSGDLLLVRLDGTVLASRFDARRARLVGDPLTVFDSVSLGINRAVQLTVDERGTMYARRGGVNSSVQMYEFVWVDRDGIERRVDSAFTFRNPAFGGNAGWHLSPDGRRVAFGRNTEAGDNIWVKELPNGPLSRISFDSAPAVRPRWTRDGRHIQYVQRIGTTTVLARRLADGTGAVDTVFARGRPPGVFEAAIAPDGRVIVFRDGGTVGVTGGRDIRIANLTDTAPPRDLLASTQFDESGIALSPDGRWLAYESNENGRVEVYIRPFPDVEGGRWQLSTTGGRAPLWSRNGREIFFVDGANMLTAVPVSGISAGGAPVLGVRRPLFLMRPTLYLAPQENYTPFDIAADGRFLMARRVELAEADISPLVVTLNFSQDIARRLRTSR